MQEQRVVEALLSRYRNLIVLAIVVVAQMLLLAWQVRTNQDVRLIRVWAVTAVTPMAGVVEAVRRNTIGFLEDYFILLDVREQNGKLRSENNQLKMQNVYLRNQLETAEHARALSVFQVQTPSKTVAARVTGNGTVSSAKVVFIDRGSTSGIEKGMAVVTPDGIVGKVIAVYPLTSQVLLVTDPTFSVGVESQKLHIHGQLHCDGSKCAVDYIQNEEKIDQGEWFYTSGEDRIFPKGFPVGSVAAVKAGQGMKDIALNLSGAPGGAEEVLVVLQGVHQQIPDTPPVQRVVAALPVPPNDSVQQDTPKMATQADKVKERYENLGKEQGHVYGAVGTNLPNFNPPAAKTNPAPASPPAGSQPAPTTQQLQAPPRSTPSVPEILGARPQQRTAPPPVEKTKPAEAPKTPSGPSLPLGAPHRKTAPETKPPQP